MEVVYGLEYNKHQQDDEMRKLREKNNEKQQDFHIQRQLCLAQEDPELNQQKPVYDGGARNQIEVPQKENLDVCECTKEKTEETRQEASEKWHRDIQEEAEKFQEKKKEMLLRLKLSTEKLNRALQEASLKRKEAEKEAVQKRKEAAEKRKEAAEKLKELIEKNEEGLLQRKLAREKMKRDLKEAELDRVLLREYHDQLRLVNNGGCSKSKFKMD